MRYHYKEQEYTYRGAPINDRFRFEYFDDDFNIKVVTRDGRDVVLLSSDNMYVRATLKDGATSYVRHYKRSMFGRLFRQTTCDDDLCFVFRREIVLP